MTSTPAHEPSEQTRDLEPEQLRLLVRVARLYHEQGVRQPQIAADLHISQPRVSRLLKQATKLGIVHTVVTVPTGVHSDVEEQVRTAYGLRDVVVAEVPPGEEDRHLQVLASSAAAYLDATLSGGDDIGISAWSASLLATVEAMRPKRPAVARIVSQVLGGIGDPNAQVRATRLLSRFAEVTGGQPVFMPTPGLVGSSQLREALTADPSVAGIVRSWEQLTLLLVGIGGLSPSPLLRSSGNAITDEEQRELREAKAVGDVCLRYIDAEGRLVDSAFDQRVVGITPGQIMRIERRVGVAGGAEKHTAIRAALLGGWVNVLVTDLESASFLLDHKPS
ncbi:sugar-binding transcriptional regulator [Kineosporia succinea]|uniref:DNA-binding transcriptional regulator LsrR (DeoR family) n=1 Tax=Kineosporia succinea TaxID=84632 RepID=A0ABT9PBP0_9ACTN|nr:sugar-binding transcriptional regulator [Kineosporia succinea]MDP9830110.1 DNA-binding transcriptional regulator LsrR (DeoR family) [Kineosporia succinea]